MKFLVTAMIVTLSLNAFSASPISRNRSAEGAQKAAIAFIKSSHAIIGDKLQNVKLTVLSTEEIKREKSVDGLSDLSTLNVEVGFDSGRGAKYSEKLEVIANSVGYVTAIKLIEE